MSDPILIQGINELNYASSDLRLDVFRRNPVTVQLASGEAHTHARSWALFDESMGEGHARHESGVQWCEVGPAGELLVRYRQVITVSGELPAASRGTAKIYAPGIWTEVDGIHEEPEEGATGNLLPGDGWWAVLGMRAPQSGKEYARRTFAVLGWERVMERGKPEMHAWLATSTPVRADRYPGWEVVEYTQTGAETDPEAIPRLN